MVFMPSSVYNRSARHGLEFNQSLNQAVKHRSAPTLDLCRSPFTPVAHALFNIEPDILPDPRLPHLNTRPFVLFLKQSAALIVPSPDTLSPPRPLATGAHGHSMERNRPPLFLWSICKVYSVSVTKKYTIFHPSDLLESH